MVTSNVSNRAKTRGDAFAGGFISVYFTADSNLEAVLPESKGQKSGVTFFKSNFVVF
jgi:hypothetical protein